MQQGGDDIERKSNSRSRFVEAMLLECGGRVSTQKVAKDRSRYTNVQVGSLYATDGLKWWLMGIIETPE